MENIVVRKAEVGDRNPLDLTRQVVMLNRTERWDLRTMTYRRGCGGRLVNFAWDQAVQMGVSGHTDRDDRWSVDPEALLMFTLRAAWIDPRLFDEVLDWMRLNLDVISAQRLRNFARADECERLASAALSWASTYSVRRSATKCRGSTSLARPRAIFSCSSDHSSSKCVESRTTTQSRPSRVEDHHLPCRPSTPRASSIGRGRRRRSPASREGNALQRRGRGVKAGKTPCRRTR